MSGAGSGEQGGIFGLLEDIDISQGFRDLTGQTAREKARKEESIRLDEEEAARRELITQERIKSKQKDIQSSQAAQAIRRTGVAASREFGSARPGTRVTATPRPAAKVTAARPPAGRVAFGSKLGTQGDFLGL